MPTDTKYSDIYDPFSSNLLGAFAKQCSKRKKAARVEEVKLEEAKLEPAKPEHSTPICAAPKSKVVKTVRFALPASSETPLTP